MTKSSFAKTIILLKKARVGSGETQKRYAGNKYGQVAPDLSKGVKIV